MNAFTREAVIRFEHCDPAGIVFYPHFFSLVNEMVEDWCAAMGHSFKTLHFDQRKAVPTVSFNASFMSPARLGDTLSQRLVVTTLGGASCQLRHDASVEGRGIARFDQTIVFIDLETMKAEPWPPQLRAAMQSYLEAS